MIDRRWLLLVGFISLLCIGCQSRPPAIVDTVDETGFPVRIEVEEQEGEEEKSVDEATIQQRMDAYRRRKAAATRPTALMVEMQPADFDPFEDRNCPPEGSAASAAKIQQNILKNRIEMPTPGDFDPTVTLAKLRKSGNDRNRWSSGKAATITGYIKRVKASGKETCNCDKSARPLTDTHIDVATGPMDLAKPVIVEITPVMRAIHEHEGLEDWSSAAVRAKYEGHRVRISGWLFFDEAHLHEADNTDPGDHVGKKNWRRTCWEIHPVTNIELLP
jgi:hypothetical protein